MTRPLSILSGVALAALLLASSPQASAGIFGVSKNDDRNSDSVPRGDTKVGASPQTCQSGRSEFTPNGNSAGGLILGKSGNRVRLYGQHPALCNSGDAAACEGRAYLVPGDAVDVGTTCGDYVRVRYIGKSRVSIGWVEKKSLAENRSIAMTGDLLSAVEGYYTSRGHCWARNANGSIERCDESPDGDSCLMIRKIDATHAEVQIQSFQNNGHECGVSGIAELTGKKLVYVQRHEGDEDNGRGFTIDAGTSNLTITYLKDEQVRANNPFCAINASLESVAFDKSTRVPVADKKCAE